jgi:hypothetical protein
MPSVEVSAPVSSAASARLALGVGWVRPGAGSIGSNSNPSGGGNPSGAIGLTCFEGKEE